MSAFVQTGPIAFQRRGSAVLPQCLFNLAAHVGVGLRVAAQFQCPPGGRFGNVAQRPGAGGTHQRFGVFNTTS